MRIQILSDLHLEFERFRIPEVDADVVVLAGDIHLGTKGVKWALEAITEVPVLYVMGNHEFYKHATPRLTEKIRGIAQGSNLQLLERDTVEIGGVRFLGATLWTDFSLFDNRGLAGGLAEERMSDYSRIRVSPKYRRLNYMDTVKDHLGSRAWLKRGLEEQGDGPCVVVTHHAPSARSVPEKYAGDVLSAAYASDLDELVASSGVDLWIHGHTHASQDYLIGKTRVVCNPRGYSDEPNPGFNPELVVEV